MRKRFLNVGLGIILLLSTLLTTACANNSAPATPSPEAPATESTASSAPEQEAADTLASIKFPLAQSVPTLDPHLTLGASNGAVTLNVFEGLFALNANYEPVPMLAESYDISEDGKTYTFHLRQGILFHNGKELKAEDAAASLNRWKSVVARAQTAFGQSEFEVADDYTITLTLVSPRNDVLYQLSHVLNYAAILPKEVIEAAGEEGITEYVGTGPYKFTEWKQDQYILVTRNDDYLPVETEASGFSGKKEALIKDIYFTFATDSATRFASFLAGEYDFVDISLDTLPQVEGQPDITVDKVIASDINLVFNKKGSLFAGIKYREAAAAAIHAEELLQGVVSSPELYRLNSSYLFKENKTWYSEAGSAQYNQKNPEKAKELLEEAGYNGEEIVILSTKDQGGTFYNAAVMLQSQLEAIGMKVRIDVFDFATMIAKRSEESSWDIYIGEFIVPSTPSQLLYIYPNYGFADDSTLAGLITALTEAGEGDEATKANDALQEYIWTYLPSVKVGDVYKYIAVRNTLEGFDYAFGFPNLSNTRQVQ